MEPLPFLLKGLVLGFSIAAPVGPIGLLCIRRTLASGIGIGLFSGLGAATADAFYGAVAAFGLAAVSNLLLDFQTALRLGGGAFLLWLAVSTFRAPPTHEAAPGRGGQGAIGAFLSTLALTATNPATILFFVAVFGSLGLASDSQGAAAALVFGVFAGSAVWWLFLCVAVATARRAIDERRMRWINRLSGLMLGGFAAYALGGLLPFGG